ncbi:MAG: hypothetical protein AB8H79_13780 [Myxococcota bacterium]
MSLNLKPAFALLTLAFLSSCGTRAPLGCIDNGDCEEREACVLEVCQPVECLSSTECGIREYCDDETFVCRAGCLEDEDCRAGEACETETNTCEVYGCRNTELDCAFGETCSAVSGECIYDNRGHCDSCTVDFWTGAQGDCPENGSFCLSFQGDAPDVAWCFLPCSTAQPCPRGYVCEDSQDFDGDGRNDPVCSAYCPDV